MPHKFDPSHIQRNIQHLLSPERRDSLDYHRVISMLPILPYHRIADIGCGPGYFTIPFAKHLFDGKVYAIDIQKEMLDAVREQVERVRLTNVEIILYREGDRLPFEDGALDGAFAAFSLHEADNPKGMLEETYRVLHRGGWLAMLEWHKRDMDEGPPQEIRIAEEDLRNMAQEAGFRFASRHNLNDKQYMITMRK